MAPIPTAPRPRRRLPRPAWALAGVLLSLAACGAKDDGAGLASVEEHPDGYWQDTRYPQGTGILEAADRKRLERLAQAGYADGMEPAPVRTGVIVHDPGRAQPGYNLYCSGHGAEAVLMDMQGQVLHRWSRPFDQVPSEREPLIRTQLTWRKVHLLEGGDLLVCYEGLGLARIDRHSELVWYWDGAAHHDFEVQDGRIITLAREARFLPFLGTDQGVIEDTVCVLDVQTGELLQRVSIYAALFASKYKSDLIAWSREGGDVLHNNSVARVTPELAQRLPRVEPGDWLLVFRDVNALAIIDLEDEVIPWMQVGPWQGPHAASCLPNGEILLFDNMGHGGFTRLVHWDPAAASIQWQYAGTPPESFVSIFSGNVARLENGNFLAAVSCAGFAREITPSGDTVWEYASPHRAGREKELVAVLFDMERLSETLDLTWLPEGLKARK